MTPSTGKGRTVALSEAVEQVKGARRIVTAMAATEPKGFFQAMSAGALAGTEPKLIYCANPDKAYDCFLPDAPFDNLTFDILFLSAKVRKLQGAGHLQYLPSHLSRWVRNVLAQGPIDVFWGSCTAPDERGFVSLSLSNTYESEILRAAKTVVLEVNPALPRVNGDTFVSVDKVDYLVEAPADQPLPTVPPITISETDRKIAGYVAEMIRDGSTIQLGIGGIPNAIAEAMATKKDLGIHTEMINDAMMELYCKGVVTGAEKTMWKEKIIGAFAYGSQELYDFIDDNPIVELHTASVVNDPYRIGRNHQMVSINTAVEIDITGQVCSESVGHTEISGVGGALDTHRGAQRSDGGRGIIAMASQTAKGKSKISLELLPGAKVSISRNDIDTVVTEYGVAHLLGKSVAERAEALIAIAHPSAREELAFGAKKYHYL